MDFIHCIDGGNTVQKEELMHVCSTQASF